MCLRVKASELLAQARAPEFPTLTWTEGPGAAIAFSVCSDLGKWVVEHYRAAHGIHSNVSDMKRPVAPFVLAVVSLILAPILVWIEFIALFLSGMVVAEPSNDAWVKVLAVVVVVVLGVITVALPVTALVKARKARARATRNPESGSGLAMAALVIAGLATLGVVAAQIYILLMVFGACSLEGC